MKTIPVVTFSFRLLLSAIAFSKTKSKSVYQVWEGHLIEAKTIQNLHWDERKGDRGRVLGVDG